MLARTTLLAVAALAAIPTTVSAVNVLTDPSFELNPLTTLSNVLTNIPAFQGQWGHENSTIFTGPDGFVSPDSFSRMLKVDSTGGSYSQTGQCIDITSYAAAVDSGNALVAAGAMFNADLPAADGSTRLSFIDSSGIWGNFTGADLASGNVTLDALPGTWQSIGNGNTIPAGTRWLFFQVAYRDDTLANSQGLVGSGYVDSAVVDIVVVPEPTACAALGLAGLLSLPRRQFKGSR